MSTAAEIFARVLEQAPHRRDAFLERVTRGRPELRAEVESLLEAHTGLGGFLGGFLDTEHRDEDRAETIAEPTSDAVPGHRLVRKIGEGGSGTVHLAREEGTLSRDVAVKFLKRDRLSPMSLQRFDSERNILAGLQHRSIARIFTAGTAALGCPYYTMEWVDGPAIDRFCDEQRSSVADRVDLFLEVCAAVAHAHQRGVIHGDLKPGNVLVCTVDGLPQPKVIDFGISRVVGDRSPRTESKLGTLRTMSPEQRQGDEPDTRCDVFALGVLLHWLLVGPTHEEPENSSATRTFDQLDPDLKALRAAERSTTIRRLQRTLTGDLDKIVGLATRPDPEQRYQTVQALEADLCAFRTGRPLPSQPRRTLDLLRRFLRRNRTGLATVLALFAAGS